MLWLRCGLLLFMSLKASDAVKVNMMGSLSLGKDVMSVLEDYVKQNLVKEMGMEGMSGRRMMSPPDVQSAIKTAALCKGLIFCSGDTESLVNDYIEALSKAISEVFKGILKNDAFEYTSHKYIRDIRKILKHANSKVHEENEVYMWTDVLKKISTAMFEKAVLFTTERLDSMSDKTKVIHVITQPLVLAVGRVETDYQTKLCTAHKICIADLECTQALNIVFEPMKTMQESKLRVFVKVFRVLLVDTPLWTGLAATVREEFRRVLNEMVNKPDAAVRDILLAFQKVLEDRLARTEPSANDVLLINCILSDMDHIYNHHKKHPFEHFLSKYDDWVNQGGSLEIHMKKLFKEITNRMDEQTDEFTRRLMTQVSTFLELTVGNGTSE
ncbi:uncharacterized protein [Choristoneura fumiferana]|uniref:uncharacterized protein n=1 Tax=Choristoneura fumiferana TaxID=7141 RepID=UPI003D158D5C